MLRRNSVAEGSADLATDIRRAGVSRPVPLSKQCRDISYNLACIAQDLGALNPVKKPDDRALQAAEQIAKAVGDREPQVWKTLKVNDDDNEDSKAKETQTLKPSASVKPKKEQKPLTSTMIRDPVVMAESRVDYSSKQAQRSMKYVRRTSYNPLGSEAKGVDAGEPKEPEAENDKPEKQQDEMSRTDGLSEASSSDSSDGESVDSRVSSIDPDDFDASRWRDGLIEMLSSMQSKSEWETMSVLRRDWQFKDSDRASDLVNIEAIQDMREVEMDMFDKATKQLDAGLEDQQLQLLDKLNGFRQTLSSTINDIIKRRAAKAKEKRKFTFENMKMVDIKALKRLQSAEAEQEKQTVVEVKPKINLASELLTRISEQQGNMNQRVGEIHIKETAADLSEKAFGFLKRQLAAAEAALMGKDFEDVADPPPEVKELLKSLKDKVPEKQVAEPPEEKEQASKEEYQHVEENEPLAHRAAKAARDLASAGDETQDQAVKDLEVEIQGLALKVQQLTRMKDLGQTPSNQSSSLQQVRKVGTASRRQAMTTKKLKENVNEQLSEGSKPGTAQSQPVVTKRQGATNSSKGGAAKNKSKVQDTVIPAVSRIRAESRLEDQKSAELLQRLEKQLPAAQKQVSDIQADYAAFQESMEKAQILSKMFDLQRQGSAVPGMQEQQQQQQQQRLGEVGPSVNEQQPFDQAQSMGAAPAMQQQQQHQEQQRQQQRQQQWQQREQQPYEETFGPQGTEGWQPEDAVAAAESSQEGSHKTRMTTTSAMSKTRRGRRQIEDESAGGSRSSATVGVVPRRPPVNGRRPSVQGAGSVQSASAVEPARGKAGVKALEKEHAELERKWQNASELLGETLNAEVPGSIEAGESVLEAKKSALKKKQDILRELQAELQKELDANSSETRQGPLAAAAASPLGAASQEVATQFASGTDAARRLSAAAIGATSQGNSAASSENLWKNTGSDLAPIPTLSERRRSREALAEQALEGSDIKGSPELIAKLLYVQGENIELVQQINQYNDIRILIGQRQGQLSKSELQSIKQLLFPDDGKDPLKMEVLDQMKKLRELQRRVKDKRTQWANMDGAASVLKSFKSEETSESPGGWSRVRTALQKMKAGSALSKLSDISALQKIKAASAAFSRVQNVSQLSGSPMPPRTESLVSDSSAPRMSISMSRLGGDVIALQAAAMIARAAAQKAQGEAEGASRNVSTSRSGSKEKANEAVSASPSINFKQVAQAVAGARRHSLASALVALKKEKMEEMDKAQDEDLRVAHENVNGSLLGIDTVGGAKAVKDSEKSVMSHIVKSMSIRRGRAAVGVAPVLVVQGGDSGSTGKPEEVTPSFQSPGKPPAKALVQPKQPSTNFFQLSGKRLSVLSEPQNQTDKPADKAASSWSHARRILAKPKAVSFGEQEVHELPASESSGLRARFVKKDQDQLLKDEGAALKAGLSHADPDSQDQDQLLKEEGAALNADLRHADHDSQDQDQLPNVEDAALNAGLIHAEPDNSRVVS
eukprot:TRINITY_DN1192_c1_g6_i1.p1 TRINITY_DN1192_c1_g6~~TRINITY_DN1192_c1_g6_i1.p1  ORF type:complete len:1505 (+),score=403.86 TRINITY_DN1192_c1_g6_i1:136-4650(+)